MKQRKKRKLPNIKSLPVFLVVAISLITISTVIVRGVYINNLKPVNSSVKDVTYFTVTTGESVDQISKNLKSSGLVRSSVAFKNYVRTNELNDKLQAGTYVLSPSLSVQQVVAKMIGGDVAKNLLTILPGKRIDEIKTTFQKDGYSTSQISAAFSTATYLGHPILNYLPKGASLEGLLYPDSFQKVTGTPAEAIVRESLNEMQKHLTSDILSGFANHNLTTYQGLVLASIVYQETGDPDSMPTVAQVFLSRLAQSMKLESNVTANYAADLAGVARTTDIDSPYNTYKIDGLPPTPISTFPEAALQAVAHPSSTDYLYFIAGDDDKMHFTHTKAEHEQAISQYCQKKCLQP